MPIPEDDPRIRLLKTAFVVYHHADLPAAKQFLLDFGLTIAEEKPNTADKPGSISFRGYGPSPIIYIARPSTTGESYFGGAAYTVESRSELLKASKIEGASKIRTLHAPGGGEFVTLTDPAGHKVHLVYGQQDREMEGEEGPGFEKLVVNYEDEKNRVGKFHRFTPGPVPVHKWGHYGVTYPPGMYDAMYSWYTTHLALAPSDIVNRDSKPITAFFHIDRGLEYTDHHAFFFKPAKPDVSPDVAHAAFEVHDFDTQMLGHDYLVGRGYKLCWGVGRHVLGSQVFDYWFDGSGFVVEHYADGDLVNGESEVSVVKAGPEALSVWGPPVSEFF